MQKKYGVFNKLNGILQQNNHKMKKISLLILTLISLNVFSQEKNFIDLPYLETSAKCDTLVTPDRIFLKIIISEKDTKGKISVEELETTMNERLKKIGINTQTQLTLKDLASNYKKYLLKQQDIQKTKNYSLLVYDSKVAGKVLAELEEIGISNITLEKTEYSKIDEMFLTLKQKAVEKAKKQANYMAKALNQKIGSAIFISDLKTIVDRNNFTNFELQEVVMVGYSNRNKQSYVPIDIEFEKIGIESQIYIKFKITE
jgi:uncharacterized protein YggE